MRDLLKHKAELEGELKLLARHFRMAERALDEHRLHDRQTWAADPKSYRLLVERLIIAFLRFFEQPLDERSPEGLRTLLASEDVSRGLPFVGATYTTLHEDINDLFPGLTMGAVPAFLQQQLRLSGCSEKQIAAAMDEHNPLARPSLYHDIIDGLGREGFIHAEHGIITGHGVASYDDEREEIQEMVIGKAVLVLRIGHASPAKPPTKNRVTELTDNTNGTTPPIPRSAATCGWLARGMLLVRDHPDWPDCEIAKQVGIHPGQLSRSPEYQRAADIARGHQKKDIPPARFSSTQRPTTAV